MSNCIDIKNLSIKSEEKELLKLSFKISNTTALIGESGSGKSLTLKALLNLLPSKLKIQKQIDSSFELNYENIGFIPQNPFTSLSPMTKIKDQFFCEERKKIEALKLVNLSELVLNKYPNELSGGESQRVIIAIALSKNIKVLLLDEPTTALDIENKEAIIKLIHQLINKFNLLVLFVTHDIDSIKTLCEEIVIIKKGEIVEMGKTMDIFNNPKESYTKKLIDSTFKNKDFRK